MDEFTSAKSCLKKSRTDFFNILLENLFGGADPHQRPAGPEYQYR